MQKLLIATSLLFTACHNPNYCAGNPDNNCNETGGSNDGGIDGNESISCVNTGCVGNAAGSVCDTNTKACVQCTVGPSGDHSACALVTPICSTTDTCRACVANSECASDACLPDGSCAAPTDVAWVSSTGAGDCSTPTSACSKVTTAQALSRSVIRISGTVTDNVTFNGGASRTLIGDDAGSSTITSTTGVLLTLTGTNAKFVVSKVNFVGTSTNLANGVVVVNDGMGHLPMLEMHQASIKSCGGVGLYATGGTVNFERGMISSNLGGGVSLSSTTYHFTNAIIATNGSTSSTATGGIYLLGGTGVVEFSTIADNTGTNNGQSRGVNCQGTSASFDSVILNANATTQTGGTGCTFVYSSSWPDAVPTAAANTNDLNTEVTFIANYRLPAGSPMKDHANTTSSVMLDIDNDARPQDIVRDIGADELP